MSGYKDHNNNIYKIIMKSFEAEDICQLFATNILKYLNAHYIYDIKYPRNICADIKQIPCCEDIC